MKPIDYKYTEAEIEEHTLYIYGKLSIIGIILLFSLPFIIPFIPFYCLYVIAKYCLNPGPTFISNVFDDLMFLTKPPKPFIGGHSKVVNVRIVG